MPGFDSDSPPHRLPRLPRLAGSTGSGVLVFLSLGGFFWGALPVGAGEASVPEQTQPTERLRQYYQRLLAEDPRNERARAFLFPEPGDSPGVESAKRGADAAVASLSAWSALPWESRWTAWQEAWAGASGGGRLQLVEAGPEELPVAHWAEFIDRALGLVAPGDARRTTWSRSWARQAAGTPAAGAVRALLRERGRTEGDAGLLVAAAELAAREGDEKGWQALLKEAAGLAPGEAAWRQAEWEAAMAGGEWARARQVADSWRKQNPLETDAWLAAVETELSAGEMERAWQVVQAEGLADRENGRGPDHDRGTSPAREEARAAALLTLSQRLSWPRGREEALRRQAELAPEDPEPVLALLDHLLAWRQFEEARQVVAEFSPDQLTPEGRLEFHTRWAQMRLSREGAAAAVEALRPVLDVVHENPSREKLRAEAEESVLLLVEYLVLAGERDEAVKLLVEWTGSRPDLLPSRRTDRRLFDLMETAAHSLPEESRPDVEESFDLRRVVPGRPGESEAVRALLADWEKEARGVRETNSPTMALRLARFYFWSGREESAEAVLLRTRHRWPDSVEVHEELLELARARAQRLAVRESLSRLAELDGARADEWKRQWGFALIEDGLWEKGMELLTKRVAEAPNPSAAARDVALAWQLQESWFASEEAWREALDLAQTEEDQLAARRGWEEARQHLGGARSEAEAMIPREDAARESTDQSSAGRPDNGPEDSPDDHHESVAGAVPPTLRTLEARNAAAWKAVGENLPAEAQSVFWEEAAGRFPRDAEILKRAAAAWREEGEPGRAAGWLQQAWVLEPPEAGRALQLARELEEVGDRTRALDFYEMALELDVAALAGDEPFPVFLPLSPEEEAASAEALYRVRREGGSWSGAWAVLVPSGDTALPPVRLQALEALGRLARDSIEKQPWLDRWLALTSRRERAHALGGMGETDLLVQTLRQAMEADPLDYPAAAAYFDAALAFGKDFVAPGKTAKAHRGELDAGAGEMAGDAKGADGETSLWAQAADAAVSPGGDVPERVDFFLRALGRWARWTPEVDVQAWKEIFLEKPSRQSLLWPSARILAGAGQFEAALELGEVAWAFLPDSLRAEASVESLEWAVNLGSLEWARRISQRPVGEFSDLTQPAASLWRAHWLLATAEEREELLQRIVLPEEDAAEAPPEAARFLLEALAGYPLMESAAARVLRLSEETFRSGDSSGLAAVLRAEVEQLQEWKLTEAAAALLQATEQSDPALLALRGQLPPQEQAQLAVMATALLLANKTQDELSEMWEVLILATGAGTDFQAAVARQLENMGEWLAAVWVWQRLLPSKDATAAAEVSVEGADSRAVAASGLLRAAQQAGDSEAVARALREGGEGAGLSAETLAWLLDARMAQMDWTGARHLLEESAVAWQEDPALLARWTALEFLSGNEQAIRQVHEALWQKENRVVSGEVLGRLSLQSDQAEAWRGIMEQLPNQSSEAVVRSVEAALDWLEGNIHGLAAPERFAWGEALTGVLSEKFPDSKALPLRLAALMGWSDVWQERLDAAEPLSTAELQVLVAMMDRGWLDASWRYRWHERVARQPAMDDPAFWLAWERLQGVEDEAWERLMETWWKGGQGHLFAGEALLRFFARTRNEEKFRQIFQEYMEHSPPAEALEGVVHLLEENTLPELGLEILPRIPPTALRQPAASLREVRWRHQTGDYQRAESILASWEGLSLLRPELVFPVAETYVDLGAPRHAVQLYQSAARTAPAALRKALLIGGAKAALAAEDILIAEDFLRQAARWPGAPMVTPVLLAWMQQCGRLDVLEAAEVDLWLAGRERSDFRLAVARYWLTEKRREQLRVWLDLYPDLRLHPALQEATQPRR